MIQSHIPIQSPTLTKANLPSIVLCSRIVRNDIIGKEISEQENEERVPLRADCSRKVTASTSATSALSVVTGYLVRTFSTLV